MAINNKKELKKKLSSLDKKISVSRRQLKVITKENKQVKGTYKAEYIMASLEKEREITVYLCEAVEACCVVGVGSKAKSYNKSLKRDVKSYNSLAKDWKKITGQKLPTADVSMGDCIIAGKEYQPISKIALA